MMDKNKVRITVIIAVYNVEKYIGKCLQSVCNQVYEELEIIVVDDGSTDESGKICDSFAEKDSRIQVIHKQNSGVSSARNQGLTVATGDYVTFVDGDDYIDENMYARLVAELSGSDTQMAICSFRYVYHTKAKNEKCPLGSEQVSKWEYLDGLLKDAFGFYYSVVWNKLIRRDLIVNNRIVFDEQWSIMEDFRFVLQLLPHVERIVVCRDALYNYRKNNSGTATNRQISFEESFCNRRQGYLWLKECLEVCDCYEKNRKRVADYLIRYLASQYAKAVYADNRKDKLCEHREMKRRDFITTELGRLPILYKCSRMIYWNFRYLWSGMIQQLRKKVRRR